MEKSKKTLFTANQAQLDLLEFEDVLYKPDVVEVAINTLIRPNYSSRKLVDKQINALKTTLNRFGFLGGIFVEANHFHVIDGWYRAQEWKRMGFSTIPCYMLNCTPNQERALHLGLNQQSATFDPSTFGIEFKDFDLLTDFGIDLEDLAFTSKGHQEKFSRNQRREKDGFTKLSTTVPISAYDRLLKIRKEIKAPNISEVLITLIKYYDEAN